MSTETNANGSTPALNVSEFVDAVEYPKDDPKKVSSLELAAGIEVKLKLLLETIEKNDADVSLRITKLAEKIDDFKKQS